MRSLLAVLAAVTVTAAPAAQHAASPLDQPLSMPVSVMTPVQDRDIVGLAGAIGHLARIPLGFEELPDTRETTREGGRRRVQLSATTAGEALAELVRLDPRYDVREMSGVVVVRPKVAWADARNPLNQPVNNVALDDVSVSMAVARVVGMLYGPGYGSGGLPPEQTGERPLSIRVASGGVLEVLNEIARVRGDMTWMVQYRGRMEPEPRTMFSLWVRTYDGAPFGLGHALPTLPLSLRQP